MEKLKLWEKTPLFDESIGQEEPTLTPYLLEDGKKHGAVIVCPGGGYSHKAAHEGGPIAQRLNEQGINALVLDYRVAPYRHPAPLLDALRAIRYVRYHAEKLGVLPDKIGILGFSAGGHLTCTAATLYDKGNPEAEDPIDRVSARPDVFIPCYPVASLAHFWHQGSANNLLGDQQDMATLRKLTAEYQVTEDTPPAFIWHTAEDNAVPVENSLRLAKALVGHNVPVSMHIFPYGPHGVGLGNEESPLAEQWSYLLGEFLKDMGF